MNYGICQGGPFNKKHLADLGDVFPVWRGPDSGKIITGLWGKAAEGFPPIGKYTFQNGEWVWTDK